MIPVIISSARHGQDKKVAEDMTRQKIDRKKGNLLAIENSRNVLDPDNISLRSKGSAYSARNRRK